MSTTTTLPALATGSSTPQTLTLPWGDRWLACDDALGRRLTRGQGFEENERLFLQNYLRPGMTVLDVGAHHGFFALLASSRVGATGHVYAFEPSLRERKRLTEHLKLNHRDDNVTVCPVAVGAASGSATLHVCQELETGCNSLRPPVVKEPTAPATVQVTTLDQFAMQMSLKQIDFIKLDVEGAELEALQGATSILSGANPPLILIEMADVRTAPWGYPCSRIHGLLADKYGYNWYSLGQNGALTPCPPKEKYHENLIAAPRHLVSQLEYHAQ